MIGAPAVGAVELTEMDGVGTGTREREHSISTYCIYLCRTQRNISCRKLTLDSDGGRGGDGATESGSAGVLSSLRC